MELKFQGAAYHGWQRQDGIPTVQQVIEDQILILTPNARFHLIGCSRLDARVSANQYFALLVIDEEILNCERFVEKLNQILPSDIEILNLKIQSQKLSLISDAKKKIYQYHFVDQSNLIQDSVLNCSVFKEQLNLDLMREGARMFEGTKSFHNYCYRPKKDQNFIRKIEYFRLKISTREDLVNPVHFFEIEGEGFMRYQIRLMIGTLINLSNKKITLTDIESSFNPDFKKQIAFAVPANGLILEKIELS